MKFLVCILVLVTAPAALAQQICGTTIPCALGWTQISNTAIKTAGLCPTYTEVQGGIGCDAVTDSWGGGFADPQRDHMCIRGGGHNDYLGNEIYCLDLTANPITVSKVIDATHGANVPTCGTGNFDSYADGRMSSRHLYDGEVYVADRDMVVFLGGSTPCNGAFTNNTFATNPATWADTNEGSNIPGGGGTFIPMAAYDPVNKLVYGYDNNLPGFWSYNLGANTFTTLSTSYSASVFNADDGAADFQYTADIDPIRRLLIGTGRGGAWKVSLNSPYTATALSMTNCGTLASSEAPGWVYYQPRGQFVGWNGGNTVYFYNPDTDSCTSTTYSNGPGSQSTHGTYGRFRYFPHMGVFALVNSMSTNFFLLRADTPADANFGQRCHAVGVLNCQGFDNATIFSTLAQSGSSVSTCSPGICTDGFYLNGAVPTNTITQDTTTFLSGGSSANFLIPANGHDNDTGNYWGFFGQQTNNVIFGQNSDFYVQVAFRADSTWTSTNWANFSSNPNSAPKLWIFHNVISSCAEEEITTHNHNSYNLPTVYTDCGVNSLTTGSDGVTYSANGDTELAFQSGWKATPAGYECDYNNGNKFTGPNCFFFSPSQWYTFYYHVHVGTWQNAGGGNCVSSGTGNLSTIEAWVAPYGSQAKKFVDVHNFPLCQDANVPGWNTLELTQFQTGKNLSGGPAAHVWYDELIVSSNPIADPATLSGGTSGSSGTPSACVSPSSLSFGNQFLQVSSLAQDAVLTNCGTASLSVTNVMASGPNAGDFLIVTSPSTNCGGSLAANATCTISVTFTPSILGSESASVSITDSAAGSPQSVSLSGLGILPSRNAARMLAMYSRESGELNEHFSALRGY